MMGLNHQDVETMMQGIAAPGQAFAQRRQQDIEKDVRDRQLEVEMRRMQAEQDRNNLLQEGHVDQWLQADPDEEGKPGKVTHYFGPPSGLKKFMDSSAQNGTDFRPIPPPKAKPPISFVAEHPDGTKITTSVDSPKDALDLHDQLIKNGFGKAKGGFNTAPTRNKQAWDSEYEKAAQYESDAEKESEPVHRQMLLDKAKEIRGNADLWFKPKAAGADEVTETQEFDKVDANQGSPAVPPSSGFLGIGSNPGKPAVPPTPFQPKRRITIKRPAGAGAESGAVQQLPADKKDLVVGQKYQAKGKVWTWDGQKLVK